MALNNDTYYYDTVRKNIRKYCKEKRYTDISLDYLAEIEVIEEKRASA